MGYIVHRIDKNDNVYHILGGKMLDSRCGVLPEETFSNERGAKQSARLVSKKYPNSTVTVEEVPDVQKIDSLLFRLLYGEVLNK